MAFVRLKQRKGRTYAYWCESYRDPASGQPRQRVLRYLGVVPTGRAPLAAAGPHSSARVL